MNKKLPSKIRNWNQYNRSLVNRGNLSIWIPENLEKIWLEGTKSGGLGRPNLYSNQCFELILTLRFLFNLPLRSTEGFVRSLLSIQGIDLPVPSYTQISRRSSYLKLKKEIFLQQGPMDLVVDSTGLKIYGEGEWKVKIHGKQQRRRWRKLHICADPKTHLIQAHAMTTSNTHDDTVMKDLLRDQKNINHVYADGAYISKNTFDSIVACGANAKIPIRSGTTIVKDPPSPGIKERNRLIREIQESGGKTLWKKSSGYHKRSLVETQMYRFKQILGGSLRSRVFQSQETEVGVKIQILNKMTTLGMPVRDVA